MSEKKDSLVLPQSEENRYTELYDFYIGFGLPQAIAQEQINAQKEIDELSDELKAVANRWTIPTIGMENVRAKREINSLSQDLQDLAVQLVEGKYLSWLQALEECKVQREIDVSPEEVQSEMRKYLVKYRPTEVMAEFKAKQNINGLNNDLRQEAYALVAKSVKKPTYLLEEVQALRAIDNIEDIEIKKDVMFWLNQGYSAVNCFEQANCLMQVRSLSPDLIVVAQKYYKRAFWDAKDAWIEAKAQEGINKMKGALLDAAKQLLEKYKPSIALKEAEAQLQVNSLDGVEKETAAEFVGKFYPSVVMKKLKVLSQLNGLIGREWQAEAREWLEHCYSDSLEEVLSTRLQISQLEDDEVKRLLSKFLEKHFYYYRDRAYEGAKAAIEIEQLPEDLKLVAYNCLRKEFLPEGVTDKCGVEEGAIYDYSAYVIKSNHVDALNEARCQARINDLPTEEREVACGLLEYMRPSLVLAQYKRQIELNRLGGDLHELVRVLVSDKMFPEDIWKEIEAQKEMNSWQEDLKNTSYTFLNLSYSKAIDFVEKQRSYKQRLESYTGNLRLLLDRSLEKLSFERVFEPAVFWDLEAKAAALDEIDLLEGEAKTVAEVSLQDSGDPIYALKQAKAQAELDRIREKDGDALDAFIRDEYRAIYMPFMILDAWKASQAILGFELELKNLIGERRTGYGESIDAYLNRAIRANLISRLTPELTQVFSKYDPRFYQDRALFEAVSQAILNSLPESMSSYADIFTQDIRPSDALMAVMAWQVIRRLPEKLLIKGLFSLLHRPSDAINILKEQLKTLVALEEPDRSEIDSEIKSLAQFLLPYLNRFELSFDDKIALIGRFMSVVGVQLDLVPEFQTVRTGISDLFTSLSQLH